MEPAPVPAKPTPPAADAADFCAVFVLGADGRIAAANPSAHALWQTRAAEMIGEAFVSLFAFEVFSADPDFLEAQWEAVLAGALERPIDLVAQPREGAPRTVRVRIEQATGSAGGPYLAIVRLPANQPGEADAFLASLRELEACDAVGFFVLDWPAGRARFSPAWRRVLGYASGEIAETPEAWLALVHPEDSAASPARAARRARPGVRAFTGEFRMRHQRGHWVWVRCAGAQAIAESGAVERFTGMHFDITDRRELEDALAANDARLNDLGGEDLLAIFEADFAQGQFWFSPGWSKLLGYADGELATGIASLAAALPPAAAAEGVESWLLSRGAGEGPVLEPMQLRAKDGRPVPVIFGAHRSLNRRRELTRVVGFACRLPHGVREDGALPAQLVHEALAALGEGVLVTDARGNILVANATAARLLGSEAAALAGRPLSDVFRLVHRETGRGGDDPAERALAAERPLPLIAEHALASAAPGGAAMPVVWTARAAHDAAGNALGVVVVFRNPAEMSLTPDERVRANRFESLGLQAGAIAHDFNNLLTTILGAVSLARDNRNYAALGEAERAVEAAKGLTRQLLAFAKGSAGAPAVCAAQTLLDDAVKMAAAASAAEITVRVPADTAPVRVERAQLLQVFQNLVINALQAMPPPPHRPRLELSAHNTSLAAQQEVPGLPAGDYVEFEVRDNGSGIAPQHLAKIFDPFFTTKKHGTGLGLATVLAIVRRHGGQIGLDTQVGVGTAFTIYLPRATEPVEAAAHRAPSLRFGTGRILLMDDDPRISELTSAMLASLDYKYDLARNGDEAIALYQRYLNIGRPYDVVIMDLTVIGGMGGEECFAHLKKLDPEVRAIIASGYDHEDYVKKFLEQGFCGYLAKPYRVAELGKILKTVLGGG